MNNHPPRVAFHRLISVFLPAPCKSSGHAQLTFPTDRKLFHTPTHPSLFMNEGTSANLGFPVVRKGEMKDSGWSIHHA